MNKILLVASGGLANRMRAIASVIALAEERHCTPTIVWTCNSDLNAPLSDIFLTKPFSDVQVIAPSAIDAILKYEIPRKKNLYLSSIYQRCNFDVCIYEGINFSSYTDKNNHLIDSKINTAKRVFIFTGSAFCDYSDQLYQSLFRFSPVVTARASKIAGGNVCFDAGMHIRRTDNRQSINESPLSLFEKQAQEIVSNNSKARLFLATDDQLVKQHFHNIFPNNIIFNTTPASRITREGMIDGAAEMYILSQCNQIFGSYWSSYTEAAATIGNKPLSIVRK